MYDPLVEPLAERGGGHVRLDDPEIARPQIDDAGLLGRGEVEDALVART